MGMDDEILDISNMLLALHGREDDLQRHSRPDARLPHHCIFVQMNLKLFLKDIEMFPDGLYVSMQ